VVNFPMPTFMPGTGSIGRGKMGNVIATSKDEDYASNELRHLDDGIADAEEPPPGRRSKRPAYIIGPNGDVITIADLPSPKVTRWVIRRKAEVVLAVHAGLISREEACKRYRLTVEEFLSWQAAIERHGLLGLRTTQLKQYRYGRKN